MYIVTNSHCPLFRRLVLAILIWLALPLGRPPVAVAACPPPPGYLNITTLQQGDLRITLATDRADYVVNQAVNMYLGYENTGTTSITIPNIALISPLESFIILPTGCNFDTPPCISGALFAYPAVVSFFGSPVFLAPGACQSYTRQWHGTPAGGGTTFPGFYDVLGGLHSDLGRFYAPVGGIRLTIRINPELPVPVESASWSGLKARAAW